MNNLSELWIFKGMWSKLYEKNIDILIFFDRKSQDKSIYKEPL